MDCSGRIMKIVEKAESGDQTKSLEIMELLIEDFQDTDTTNVAIDKCINEAEIDILLKKLKCSIQQTCNQDDEVIGSSTLKLYSYLLSSDKRTRHRTLVKLWKESSEFIGILVEALKMCKNNICVHHIVGILHECLSPRMLRGKVKESNKNAIKNNGRIVLLHLRNLEATQILLQLLVSYRDSEQTICESISKELIWILGQIAQIDRTFITSVLLLNATKVFHSLLKQYHSKKRRILPLLLIIRSLSKNQTSIQLLIKAGIAETFEKLFVSMGCIPHQKLKILLDCLKNFTTETEACTSFVKLGIVNLLMQLFRNGIWNGYEGLQLKLKIWNCALNTLQHISSIKLGREATKDNDGLKLLYSFCTNCPDDKVYDCLLLRICAIIYRCLHRQELPIPRVSPLKFVLPETYARRNSDQNGLRRKINAINSVYNVSSDTDSDDDDDDDDVNDNGHNGDNDNDHHDGEERGSECLLRCQGVTGDADEKSYFSTITLCQRSEKDLLGYIMFFKELEDFESQVPKTHSSHECTTDSHFIDQFEGTAMPISDFSRSEFKNLDIFSDSSSALTKCNIDFNFELFRNVPLDLSDEDIYCNFASATKSVITFVKLAYPDLIGGNALSNIEPLNKKDRKMCRSKFLTCVGRGLHKKLLQGETIYNLDDLVANSSANNTTNRFLRNYDKDRIGKPYCDAKHLLFESRFESGNLRKAIQIGAKEYDLVLSPDVNSDSKYQWFYFEVSNMENDVPYTFNIINCEKPNSQFNFGMKPIMFSVTEASLGREGWTRTGTDICYYQNCYQHYQKNKNYFTTSFTVTFRHAYDVCYLAYHFPYTYARLMSNVWKWTRTIAPSTIYFRVERLCRTLNENESLLLTITSPDTETNPIRNRKIIFLTSRIHPGESNASWVMQGTLETLLSDTTYATSLREDYIFKIVPMLNVEGVVNGCNCIIINSSRCGLTNEDLNRRWSNPEKTLHPVIFHTKGLIEYCTNILKKPPHIFVDYHGHSRRKNIFLFGCSKSASWSSVDRSQSDQPMEFLLLPHLMQITSPAFALSLCSFKVEKHKESTARIAVWRQLGISRSYTMESSFCGCDQGALAGLHLNTDHLRNVGQNFCEALSMMDRNKERNIEKPRNETCCPLYCTIRRSRNRTKCIQDKHAMQHLLELL